MERYRVVSTGEARHPITGNLYIARDFEDLVQGKLRVIRDYEIRSSYRNPLVRAALSVLESITVKSSVDAFIYVPSVSFYYVRGRQKNLVLMKLVDAPGNKLDVQCKRPDAANLIDDWQKPQDIILSSVFQREIDRIDIHRLHLVLRFPVENPQNTLGTAIIADSMLDYLATV